MASDFRPRYCEPYRGSWRYRRKVPDDCRAKIARGSWTHNFKSDASLAQIERKAKILAAEHDKEIAVARGQEVSQNQIATIEDQAKEWLARSPADRHGTLAYLHERDPEDLSPADRAFLNAIEHAGTYRPESLSITAAVGRDLSLYSRDRDRKPLDYALNSFVATIGDKDVLQITRGDVAQWLADQAKAELSPGTIKRRLGSLRAVVGRLFLDLELPRRSPFERHSVKDTAASAKRLPLNKAMLAALDAYLDSNRPGHETKNILKLMKYTGAGPAEVSGLVLSDVSLDSEVPYIWLRNNALRGLKADVRDRMVPLVGFAISAVQDAVERSQRRNKGSRLGRDKTPLFSSFGMAGRGADSVSAKLNKALRTAGIPKSPRLTCYSLRHTMKEALRSAGIQDHIQRRILGHSGHGVADHYGSRRARLVEARDALVLALDHLGDIDDAEYGEHERMKPPSG